MYFYNRITNQKLPWCDPLVWWKPGHLSNNFKSDWDSSQNVLKISQVASKGTESQVVDSLQSEGSIVSDGELWQVWDTLGAHLSQVLSQ